MKKTPPRLNFYLDEDLHYEFKSFCAKEKQTMTNVVVRLIKEYLSKQRKKDNTN